jgi:hypothetical protein
MAGPAFPVMAGWRFRGFNGVPSPAHLALSNQDAGAAWYQHWYDWGTGTTSVRDWMRAQMVAGEAIGCNVIRFFLNPTLRYGSGSKLTAGQLATVLRLCCDDCNEHGLWFYPALSSGNHIEGATTTYGLTVQNVTDFVTETVAVLSARDNVIGFDVCQEYPASAIAITNKATWITAAKSARVRVTPVTMSYACFNETDLSPSNTNSTAIVTAGAEFRDVHVYYQPDDDHLDTLLAHAVPTFVGEMGIQQNGDFVGETPSTPAALYATMAAWGNKSDLQGMTQWSIYTVAPFGDWGIYGSYSNGAFGDLRSAQATPFQTIPARQPSVGWRSV